MYSIGEIISKNRKKKQLSQSELAQILNTRYGYDLSNKSISRWEKNTAEPSITTFFHICQILETTDIYASYFGENPNDPLSVLNEAGRERVYEYISLLCRDERYQKPRSSVIPFRRTIPLQLYPVSAGPGNFLDNENYEDIPVGDDVPLNADFAVRVSGDSMEPMFHKNQIIYIHKQSELESGEIGIFFLNGEAYVKKFQKEGPEVSLISLNKKYDPIPVSAQSTFRIFGKVVG